MNSSEELEQKRRDYLEYIDEHRRLIRKAFLNFKKANLNLLSEDEMEILFSEIKTHDDSKYGEEEFESYRKHFFPCSFENKDDAKEGFKKAVEHHYLLNDHHPQNPARKTGLNKVACIHNILDWIAMSYKFGDNVWEFYQKSEIKTKLNPEEREYIEETLDLLTQHRDSFYEPETER